jgi:hypothetical protein
MIPPPSSSSVVVLADWVELSALKSDQRRLAHSDLLDQLGHYVISDADTVAADIWHELSSRAQILGQKYPFELDAQSLQVRVGDTSFAYRFCLVLALDRVVKGLVIRDHAKAGALFERLVTPAVATYVHGEAIRIGHPRRRPVPSNFGKLLKFLGEYLCEGTLRSKPLNPDTKDCKADIVAWRSFADRRGGKIVVFVQCAASARRRTAKLSELSLELWARYIEFTVPPIRAFAVPYVEVDEDRWLESGTIGGIAFDRTRVIEMLPSHVATDLYQEVTVWADAKVASIAWD